MKVSNQAIRCHGVFSLSTTRGLIFYGTTQLINTTHIGNGTTAALGRLAFAHANAATATRNCADAETLMHRTVATISAARSGSGTNAIPLMFSGEFAFNTRGAESS